jgi:hypothetical protein
MEAGVGLVTGIDTGYWGITKSIKAGVQLSWRLELGLWITTSTHRHGSFEFLQYIWKIFEQSKGMAANTVR